MLWCMISLNIGNGPVEEYTCFYIICEQLNCTIDWFPLISGYTQIIESHPVILQCTIYYYTSNYQGGYNFYY
jgi:hypothetical protein